MGEIMMDLIEILVYVAFFMPILMIGGVAFAFIKSRSKYVAWVYDNAEFTKHRLGKKQINDDFIFINKRAYLRKDVKPTVFREMFGLKSLGFIIYKDHVVPLDIHMIDARKLPELKPDELNSVVEGKDIVNALSTVDSMSSKFLDVKFLAGLALGVGLGIIISVLFLTPQPTTLNATLQIPQNQTTQALQMLKNVGMVMFP